MNPLREKQIKTLKELNCADLARKVDEIVEFLNDAKIYKIICPKENQEPKPKKPAKKRGRKPTAGKNMNS